MRRLFAIAVLSGAIACGGGDDGGNDPLDANFQPEIVNASDAFEFQVTGVEHGAGRVSYAWRNTGTRASIDQSSSVSAGTVTLRVRDSAGVEVYAGDLAAGGTHETTAGTSGDWTIQVDFADVTGDVNFRAQKL